ncbi:MAG TPA: RNA methyltransferase [Firmicutes bacterium]|nr:RNA methyltransferase [Bacillota bacterium]
MIYYISSKQNSKIKDLLSLYKSNIREKERKFVVEGFHLLEMALINNKVEAIFTLKEINSIPENIPQYIINEDILNKISLLKNSQGVLAVVSFNEEKPISSNKVLYLDDVSDPGNLGTILRTALAFSYKDIIVSKNTCSIYNEKVIQASQGAIFKLNIIKKDYTYLKELKDYLVIATEIKGSITLDELVKKDKFVLVLGNESHGVRNEILSLSDIRLRIDIKDIESLNVAIAGAILMYELK